MSLPVVGVCYVAPDVSIPSARGASTHVLELSAALAASGDDIHVVCCRLPGQAETEEVRGVTLHRFSRWPGGIPLRSSVSGEPGPGTSRDGLVPLGYRVYLQTLNAARVGAQASGIIRKFGLGTVLERETAYGAGAFASYVTGRPMILEMIGPRSSPLSVSRCFKLLAYSSLMVPEGGKPKAEYVEAAVNPDIFRPDPEAGRRVRERLGLQGTVVGYVGTFQSFHGMGDLLRASALVLGRNPKVKFLLVGPHSREALSLAEELGVSGCTVFTGPVVYEEVASFVNASDILVAPYNTWGTDRQRQGIGSPLKVLEYMAVGKATVGSALPQLEAIIEDGKNGRLYPEGDVPRLAELILELARDPAQREALGESALALVRGKYTWHSLAERVNRLLREGTVPRGD